MRTPGTRRPALLAALLVLAASCAPDGPPLAEAAEREASRTTRRAELSLRLDNGRAIPLLSAEDLEKIGPRSTAPFPTTALQWSFDQVGDGWLLDLASGVASGTQAGRAEGPVGDALVPREGGLRRALPRSLGEEWSLFVRFRSTSARQAILSIGDALRVERRAGRLVVASGGARCELPATDGWTWLGVAFERVGDRREPAMRVCLPTAAERSALAALPQPQAGSSILLGPGVAFDELRLERAVLSTLAFERLDDPPRTSGRRPATLRGPAGTEEVLLWEAVHERAQLAGAELSAGHTDHFLASAGGLAWTPGQWRQDDTDAGPRPRTCHPTLSIGDGRLLVFGGETMDSHVWSQWNDAETWIYDARSFSWTRVHAGEGGPHARGHLSACYWPEGDVVFLRGGWFNSEHAPEQVFGDAWLFDVAACTWRQLEAEQLGRFSDAMVSCAAEDGLALVVLGSFVEVWDLRAGALKHRGLAPATGPDGEEVEWPQIVSAGHAYDPRRGRVVLFGGESGSTPKTFHDRTFAYDPRADAIEVLAEGGPPTRTRPGFAYDSRRDRFVLFGGVHDQHSRRLGDLWTFDPETGSWSRIEAAHSPSPRGGLFQMAFDAGLDATFLVAGRHSYERFLDEVWRLHLDPQAVATASWAFRADALPDAARCAFVEGIWDDADRVDLELSRSMDGLRLGEGNGEAQVLILTVTVRPADPARPPRITAAGVDAGPGEPGPGLRRITRSLRPAGRERGDATR